MPRSNDIRQARLIAAGVTLLLAFVTVALLLWISLSYNPASDRQQQWPPVDSSELLFGGEYVMVGDIPSPGISGSPAAAASPQPTAAPSADIPAPPAEAVMTQSTPSPARASSDDASRRAAEEQRAAEAARRNQQEAINSRVNFGSGSGASGSPDGNADSGAVTGRPGVGGNLSGRGVLNLPRPAASPLGTIVVNISVDRQGRVTAKSINRSLSSGAAIASAQARNRCLEAAQNTRFSADESAPAVQTGTLTYIFR